MIDSLSFRNFKCFSELDLGLGRLTLLTGLNSSGKSSIIQGLLAVHQTLQRPGPPPALFLNDDFCSLGSVHDVLDRLSGRKTFSLGASAKNCRVEWLFDASEKEALIAPLLSATVTSASGERREAISNWYPQADDSTVRDIAREIRELLHVSTDRVGPQETYLADSSSIDTDRLGAKGEYTAWFLYKNKDLVVPESLRCEGVPPQLPRQVEAWMRVFFPGASLKVERVQNTSLLTLGLRTSDKDEFYRPLNVGYGLSHFLPILVGALAARKGQMFIVENPEAHLHPAAQAQMARLLSEVASAGAQVIIESHSDHVLNGIRSAVKSGKLDGNDVAIHYFSKRNLTTFAPDIQRIRVNASGALDNWPKGFFDQIDNDLQSLVSWE